MVLLRCLLAAALALGLGAQDTTVLLFRHAERQSLLDDDAPLSDAGLRRALALAPLLKGFRPTVLFASDRQRTQQTLMPAAQALALIPQIRPQADSTALAREILLQHRGQTVVICWHHDLMKSLVKALGFKGAVPHWSLFTYDRLWVLRIPAKGEPSLEERQQGF